jgi:hypothetical protein
VAERVIDVFEPVEVHEHDGERMTVTMSRLDRVVDGFAKIAVGRQGDPVLLRLSVFVLALEIKLDLDVVWITQKNLPTGAVWNLVHVV